MVFMFLLNQKSQLSLHIAKLLNTKGASPMAYNQCSLKKEPTVINQNCMGEVKIA